MSHATFGFLENGGIGGWVAAHRVIAEHGAADLVLLFADTKVEDDDLYRFLDDAAAQIGVLVTVVANGRTPFQVFHDQRLLVLSPNGRVSRETTRGCARSEVGARTPGPAPTRVVT